ncbi:hypothetical protein J5N97_022424 [Dioscorea zingiberensis]|uniref:Uncharacterized protein n=1 Tax=Dioscorea zingiberensis TaxID=325984 RepID=A0A9D5CAG5_9LILI|nr:hypothetical protein J5N97_022424 [Dioscorea zingiberensis]
MATSSKVVISLFIVFLDDVIISDDVAISGDEDTPNGIVDVSSILAVDRDIADHDLFTALDLSALAAGGQEWSREGRNSGAGTEIIDGNKLRTASQGSRSLV